MTMPAPSGDVPFNQQQPNPLWQMADHWFRVAAHNGDGAEVLRRVGENAGEIFEAKFQYHKSASGFSDTQGMSEEDIFLRRTVENWARLKVVDPVTYAAENAKWASMLEKRYGSRTASYIASPFDSTAPAGEPGIA